jgi:hypothetical protein
MQGAKKNSNETIALLIHIDALKEKVLILIH